MPLKWRKKVILAKIETTYGTDIAPTGAANAILVTDVTISPMEGDNLSRGLVRTTLGAEPTIPVGTHVACEFSVEVAGAGTPGHYPAYGPLLRSCMMIENGVSGGGLPSRARYKPVSASFESLSIYFNNDGIRHRILGARGNVAFELNANQIPQMKFRFIGLWVEPDASALPTPTFTKFKAPLAVNNSSTPTCALHGKDVVTQSLTVDLGNELVHRNLVNSESISLAGRRSSGSITIEAPSKGTEYFFTAAKDATLAALQVVHGTADGKIVSIDAPKVQIQDPKYTESDGITMLEMGLNLTPSTGDDDLKITVK